MKKLLKLFDLMAFNGNGWKLDDNGGIVLKDGNPVYIDSAGREMIVATDTISRINAEAKKYREAKEAAETKLRDFEGIDPVVARKAVETVSKLDAKQLIDAGKVDELKSQLSTQYSTQISEKDKAISELQNKYDNMLIKNVFANSDFVRNQIAIPSDIFEEYFRKSFKIEDGDIVAFDRTGNRLLSKSRQGEYADPEEALQILVESHPQKDVLIKAQTGNGTGNSGAAGGRGRPNVMKRADFEKMSAVQQSEIAQKVGKGEMQLTD